MAFGSALNLDQPATVVHDHIEIGVGTRVFGIVQIKHRRAPQHADRDGGHLAMNGIALEFAGIEQLIHRIDQRNISAGNGRSAGAAIGLQHIAIQGNGPLAQGFQVDDGPQAAANQALDLQCATPLAAAAGLALVARAGGSRQHAIFGGDPALALVAQPGRQAFFNAGRAQNTGLTAADQHRAFSMLGVVTLDDHGSQLVGCATGRPVRHGLLSYFSGGKVTMTNCIQARQDRHMIRSMTAYAQCTSEIGGGRLIWELRSVNQRFLDLSLRLPEDFRQLEPEVRQVFKARVNRGKIEASLRFQADLAAESASLQLDRGLAEGLGRLVRELAEHTGGAAEIDAVRLLGWPGLVRQERPDFADKQAAAMALLDQAVGALITAREQEGAAIAALIEARLAGMEAQVEQVRRHLPAIRAALAQRFRERLATLEYPVDTGRIEQEVVLQLQKLDVDEELDRLGMHVAEIRRVMGLPEPVGRRLDFLMQELNREANTLGSKAAVVETGQAAVELKVLIEQMREQIQNVE